MSNGPDYYLLDARSCVGNCALWWCPDGKGYTCNLDEAGLYTLAEAESHRPTDLPVHKDVARRLVVSHVRWDHLGQAGIDIYEAQRRARVPTFPALVCPECGPVDKSDEDGCCLSCGADLFHDEDGERTVQKPEVYEALGFAASDEDRSEPKVRS